MRPKVWGSSGTVSRSFSNGKYHRTPSTLPAAHSLKATMFASCITVVPIACALPNYHRDMSRMKVDHHHVSCFWQHYCSDACCKQLQSSYRGWALTAQIPSCPYGQPSSSSQGHCQHPPIAFSKLHLQQQNTCRSITTVITGPSYQQCSAPAAESSSNGSVAFACS